MISFGHCLADGGALRATLAKHGRHLSAASMAVGFGFDNVLLKRVDIPSTQVILAAYLAIAGFSIALLHFIEVRGEGTAFYRLRNLLPLSVQFALGSMWSGFLVFYARSAVVAASWPFLLILLAIFIGSEVFNRYVARLVFSSILLFFALLSYAIFLVPIYAHAIGKWVFLLSDIAALLAFLGFLRILMHAGPDAFQQVRFKILGGSAGVLVLINVFYFVNILPPLPLALAGSGVYRSVKKHGDIYLAVAEEQPWYNLFTATPRLHIAMGDPVFAFSSVFAPIELTAPISHRWEWYSPQARRWLTRGKVTFTVTGGRSGGYRGYTVKHNLAAGDWRVDIETQDGSLIGRIRFSVQHTDETQALKDLVLTP